MRRVLLLMRNGVSAHRPRPDLEHIESKDAAIRLERVPAYAPALGPVDRSAGPIDPIRSPESVGEMIDTQSCHNHRS